MSADKAPRYDSVTIGLHWLVAFVVVFQWLGAHAIDWFPRGPQRVDARSVHIVLGALLAATLAFRAAWRARRGARLPPLGGPMTALAARAMHLGLYVTLAAVLALGIFNTWLRGDDLFGLGHIPKFGAYDAAARHALANQIVGYHRIGANLLLILAGLHAAAALAHALILKDDTLRRMAPWRRAR